MKKKNMFNRVLALVLSLSLCCSMTVFAIDEASEGEGDPITSSQTLDEPSEPASSEVSSEPASSEVSSEPASSEVSSEPASSEVSSEPASSEVSSEPASSEVSSEETSSEPSSEPAGEGTGEAAPSTECNCTPFMNWHANTCPKHQPILSNEAAYTVWKLLPSSWRDWAENSLFTPEQVDYIKLKESVTVEAVSESGVAVEVFGLILKDVVLNVSEILIDTFDIDSRELIAALDITLIDKNGKEWQPGEEVTVTLDAEALGLADGDYVGIFHEHDDEINDLGDFVVEDGKIDITVDGFSVFYVVAGTSDEDKGWFDDTSIVELPDESSTYYVEPGTIIKFDTNSTFRGNGVAGISRSGQTITVAPDAAINTTASFTVNQMTLTFVVSDRDSVVAGAITTYPIILSIKTKDSNRNTTTIPGEPGISTGSYSNLNSSYNVSSGARFASKAEEYILPTIADGLIISIDGTSTAGVYDATGVECLKYLTGIDWDEVLKTAASAGAYATDGTRLSRNTDLTKYVVVPYVIKLMAEKGLGWHIDCAVVPANRITLSYDLNLKNYVVTSTKLGVPDAVTSTNGTITTKVSSISGVSVNQTLKATLNGANYDVKFLGWSKDPSATVADIAPNSNITVTENTVLYAVWEGKADETVIKYEVVGPTGCGKVSPATETFNTASNARGSTATANDTFRFVGWYSDAACTQEITTSATFKPTAPADGWVANQTYTYYAKFELMVGELTLEKKLAGFVDNKIPDGFKVTFTITGDNYSETVTFSKDNGWSKTFENLVAGEYTITETVFEAKNYDYKEMTAEGGDVSGKVVTAVVDPGEETEVVVTNTYTPHVGDLKITKKFVFLNTLGEDLKKDFAPTEMTVTVKGTSSIGVAVNESVILKKDSKWTATLKNVLVGDYTVTESAPTIENFDLVETKGNGAVVKNAQVTSAVTKGAETTAAFTNTYQLQKADLVVDITSGTNSIDENQSYIFVITPDADNIQAISPLTVVVHGNGSVTIKDLPVGSYTVTEKDDWSWRYTVEAENPMPIEVPATGATAPFAANRAERFWLNGAAWCDNLFGKGAKHDEDE